MINILNIIITIRYLLSLTKNIVPRLKKIKINPEKEPKVSAFLRTPIKVEVEAAASTGIIRRNLYLISMIQKKLISQI
jgi:hypothetical protein